MIDDARADLHAALAAAQGEFPAIVKDKKVQGRSYAFSYASLDTILDAVRPALVKHGLAVSQTFRGDELVTLLLHKGGWSVESVLLVGQAGGAWQEFGKAVTYARRYALTAILGVAAEDDDDDPGERKPQATTPGSRPINNDQRRLLFQRAKEAGVIQPRLKEIIKSVTGAESSDSITQGNLDEVLLLVEAEGVEFSE